MSTPTPGATVVADRLEILVPAGGRVLVASDLHLEPVPTAG